jgi:hypothetical protein
VSTYFLDYDRFGLLNVNATVAFIGVLLISPLIVFKRISDGIAFRFGGTAMEILRARLARRSKR